MERVSRFGDLLGIAFKMADDLLDYRSVGELLDILDRKHAFDS